MFADGEVVETVEDLPDFTPADVNKALTDHKLTVVGDPPYSTPFLLLPISDCRIAHIYLQRTTSIRLLSQTCV
jgi:hypothetical protein